MQEPKPHTHPILLTFPSPCQAVNTITTLVSVRARKKGPFCRLLWASLHRKPNQRGSSSTQKKKKSSECAPPAGPRSGTAEEVTVNRLPLNPPVRASKGRVDFPVQGYRYFSLVKHTPPCLHFPTSREYFICYGGISMVSVCKRGPREFAAWLPTADRHPPTGRENLTGPGCLYRGHRWDLGIFSDVCRWPRAH